MSECPTEEYDQLLDDESNYCYKIVQEKETLTKAKEKCANDDAVLVCFGDDMDKGVPALNFCPLLCQMTSKSNRLSSFVCDRNSFSNSYICQKERF